LIKELVYKVDALKIYKEQFLVKAQYVLFIANGQLELAVLLAVVE